MVCRQDLFQLLFLETSDSAARCSCGQLRQALSLLKAATKMYTSYTFVMFVFMSP